MQTTALALAGAIGAATAIVHGVLTQRLMVAPVNRLTRERVSKTIGRLIPMLLQYSTFNWLMGGLALIVAAFWLGAEAKLAIAALVASSYLFGAIGNFWGTRGRHPGWVLLGLALGLIAVGVFTGGDGAHLASL